MAEGKIASQPLNDLHEQGRRWARRFERHVMPLNEYAERAELRLGYSVPMFDPDSGGIDARVLLLFESPGKATIHTRFISLDNPDMSAVSAKELCARAGLVREALVCWNVVSWFTGIDPESKARKPANPDEAERGARELAGSVIPLLTQLRAIVAMGIPAANGLAYLKESGRLPAHIATLQTHNTSMRALNPEPGRRDEVVATLSRAAKA